MAGLFHAGMQECRVFWLQQGLRVALALHAGDTVTRDQSVLADLPVLLKPYRRDVLVNAWRWRTALAFERRPARERRLSAAQRLQVQPSQAWRP